MSDQPDTAAFGPSAAELAERMAEAAHALPRFGTAVDPEGYDTLEAIERHECRPAHKSHPNHCGHCYYPWPCPTVALYRRLIGNG